jgi:hypothetical protein
MSVRQQQQKDGRVIYFLADDLGQIWLGGWFDRSVAEDRLQQRCGGPPTAGRSL